jgi:hypothetical protein
MAHLTNNEVTDIVLAYGQAGQNAVQAQHIYQKRFPDRRTTNIRTIVRIVQDLRDHGSYKPQTQDRGVQRPRRVANIEEDILSSVEDQPGTTSA